jgi:hypothetical protein
MRAHVAAASKKIEDIIPEYFGGAPIADEARAREVKRIISQVYIADCELFRK